MTSGSIVVTYTYDSATLGSLNAVGKAVTLNSLYPIVSDGFDLSMTLNPTTGAFISGTLDITGAIPSLSYSGPTLLTGTLSDFGFTTSSEPLEFIFTATGGELKSGLFPSQVGVVLNDTAFPGSFASSFETSALRTTSDSYAVPEPSCFVSGIALMLSGLGYSARRWRHGRK